MPDAPCRKQKPPKTRRTVCRQQMRNLQHQASTAWDIHGPENPKSADKKAMDSCGGDVDQGTLEAGDHNGKEQTD